MSKPLTKMSKIIQHFIRSNFSLLFLFFTLTPLMVWFFIGCCKKILKIIIKTQNKSRFTFCKMDIFVGQKMSKIEKPQNIFKQTPEIATTLWIQKIVKYMKGCGDHL